MEDPREFRDISVPEDREVKKLSLLSDAESYSAFLSNSTLR